MLRCGLMTLKRLHKDCSDWFRRSLLVEVIGGGRHPPLQVVYDFAVHGIVSKMTQLGEISFSRSLHHKRLHKDRVYVRVSTWHCAVTTRSRHGHNTVTTRSLCGHNAVTTRSPRGHYAVTAQSLHPLRFHNQRDSSTFPSASSSKARVASLPCLPSRASKSFLQKIHGRG